MININRLCQPRKEGGLALPNIEHYSISFEMSRLAKHWAGKINLDWILIERELASPFTPTDILSQKSNKGNKMQNPILKFSKMVWLEVHKKYKLVTYVQKYASLWHNPKIKINKQTIYWAHWLRKGIRTIGDLLEGDIYVI